MTRFYRPAGREFMGEWFKRELDYPRRLVNTLGQDEVGTENPFWVCRQCKRLDRERMAGIYWCGQCAREKRKSGQKRSTEEKARRAAVSAAQRSYLSPIDKPCKGRLMESASAKLRRAREGSGR